MPNGESEAYRDAERDVRGWIKHYKKSIIELSPDYKLPQLDYTKEDNLSELRDHSVLLSNILNDIKNNGDGSKPLKKFKNIHKYPYEFWTGDGSFISTIHHCRMIQKSQNMVTIEFFRLQPGEKQCFEERLNKYIKFTLRRFEGPITNQTNIEGVLSKVKTNQIMIIN